MQKILKIILGDWIGLLFNSYRREKPLMKGHKKGRTNAEKVPPSDEG